MEIQAKKAVKHQVKVKIAFIGPSGSGKTYSALKVAKGFGNRTLLLNTEGDRGYLYASLFEYDIVDLEPPFTPERYVEIINYAEQEEYDTLIIDSGSHEWSGRGGLLEVQGSMTGNSYTNWAKITPRHNVFVDKLLYCKIHTIVCLRGKDVYVMTENDKGKQAPKKEGLGAEQRANFEYEMMATLMIDQKNHVATPMKDNTGLFENRYEMLSEEHGKLLKQWAENGINLTAIKTKLNIMASLAKECKFDAKTMSAMIQEQFKVGSSKELSEQQLDELIVYLEMMKGTVNA
jgi:hypothetical protein